MAGARRSQSVYTPTAEQYIPPVKPEYYTINSFICLSKCEKGILTDNHIKPSLGDDHTEPSLPGDHTEPSFRTTVDAAGYLNFNLIDVDIQDVNHPLKSMMRRASE